jgi:hypothetical protein
MPKVDITEDVCFGEVDSEYLPLEKCKCGKEFEYWKFILSDDKDNLNICPQCNRKLFFSNQIKVYEIQE